MKGLFAAAGWIMGLSVAASAFLALAWPFIVSAERDDPAFHAIAISTFVAFLAALTVRCAIRIRTKRSI